MYDLRQSQDSINPRTSHCDVLVHTQDNPMNPGFHPFWYTCVLGIFHVNVKTIGIEMSPWHSIPFLWVHWFGWSDMHRQPIHPHHYDHIGFVTQSDDTEPFGFLDPANVVRACHLIPAFSHGQTNKLLGPSITCHEGEEDDWMHYYVNRFVDRDMAMQFSGGGVGHFVHYNLQAHELSGGLDGADAECDLNDEDPTQGLQELPNDCDEAKQDSDGTEGDEEEELYESADKEGDLSDNGYAST
ncbi:hypothetical protein K439DRAFT_1618223 [Ramaria rubella]|nr:hypothetical protein K439DRAFT_1618223 [Ramaria rubella]